MLPIVLEMTDKVGVAHEPFILVIMMAASASFATPLGYQTNLMVLLTRGYKFRDFLRGYSDEYSGGRSGTDHSVAVLGYLKRSNSA